MQDEDHNATITAKITKAHLPDELCLGPIRTLAYYPDADLLALRTGLSEGIYLTINRQGLVRFFVGFGALNRWLREHHYEPIEHAPAFLPGTAKMLEGIYSNDDVR